MFVIRRNEFHPIRRGCRGDEGIGEFHAVAQKILFDVKKRFGGDLFTHVDRFGIPLSQCLLKTSQLLFVTHPLHQLDMSHAGDTKITQ